MQRFLVIAIVIFACGGGSSALQACGDRFLMVGRGLAFGRAYAAVYPGSILIYAAPQSPSQAQKLQQNLRRAGHRVTLVDSQAALATQLLLQQADIVIADVNAKAALDPHVATLASKPSALYLVSDNDKKRVAPLPDDPATMVKGGEKPGRFLVVIDDIMKSRQQAGVRVKKG